MSDVMRRAREIMRERGPMYGPDGVTLVNPDGIEGLPVAIRLARQELSGAIVPVDPGEIASPGVDGQHTQAISLTVNVICPHCGGHINIDYKRVESVSVK